MPALEPDEPKVCAELVAHGTNGKGRTITNQCRTRATVQEDGLWWCARHAPSRVAARDRRHEEEMDRRDEEEAAVRTRVRTLAKRAAAMVTPIENDNGRPDPARVTISITDLDRLLREAGR